MSQSLPARFRLPVTLAALCAVLAGFVWYQLEASTTYTPAAASTALPAGIASKAATAPAVDPSVPPKETYVEIAERPVFLPTRRPAAAMAAAPSTPKAAPARAAPSPLQSYSLVGVLLDGNERVAVLKKVSSPHTVRVIEGDTVQGWTAATIAADRVVFRTGSSEYVVEFPKPALTSTNPPTSAPRPAPVSNANLR